MRGKPRIVSQQYLGSADEVIAKLSETPTGGPIRSRHKRFGDLAAVWSTLVRLDVAGIVDEVVPRRADAAASVGTYLALACANRIVDPCSKRGFADWWATTAGQRWVKTGSGRGGSPPVLGRDGPSRRGRAAGDRDPARPRDGRRVRARPDRAGAGHDQLRHLHRHRQRARADRAARQGQAEADRSAAGRVGAGAHPRRRGAGDQPRLSRRPARRHPVPHGRRRAGGPLPGPGRRCRVADRGL